MVGCAVPVRGPLPWSGVLCWSVTRLHGWTWFVGAWPAPMVGPVLVRGSPPWSGVPCRCVARFYGRACCVGAGLAAVAGHVVLVLGSAGALVDILVGCALLVLVRGLSPWLGMLCWWLACRHGRACCADAWPVAAVPCWCCARLPGRACRSAAWSAVMVGRAVLVPGPPAWSGVPCWRVARLHGPGWCAGARPAWLVGCAIFVVGPPLWSGVLCWRATRFPGWAPMPVRQICHLHRNVFHHPKEKRFDIPWPWDSATSTIRCLAFHGVSWPRCSLGPAWSYGMYSSVGGNAPLVGRLLRRTLMLPTGALRCRACAVVLPPVLAPLGQPPGQALGWP